MEYNVNLIMQAVKSGKLGRTSLLIYDVSESNDEVSVFSACLHSVCYCLH